MQLIENASRAEQMQMSLGAAQLAQTHSVQLRICLVNLSLPISRKKFPFATTKVCVKNSNGLYFGVNVVVSEDAQIN